MEDKNYLKEILREELKSGERVTKNHLLMCLGWNRSKERELRYLISDLASEEPVIATSNKSGYKIATKVSDLAEVEHQLKEINSRINALEKRKEALNKFYKKMVLEYGVRNN